MNAKTQNAELRRKIDSLMSYYVFLRDGGRCVLCGTTEQLGNSHFFRRGLDSVRWDRQNCALMCNTHNQAHDSDTEPYYDWFLGKYGLGELGLLEHRSRQLAHFKEHDLLLIQAQIEVWIKEEKEKS